ncbi:MAG: efflux RND transporter periplasmic adaptor subunit [Gemmatimonadales bacterium]|nr:efflux RND transporter periplasmic adaptor subunit [Gemmatimonadales bacterium]NIN10649.1 efflux RND transporter periplasmic adaptor subunit [Gemmatimonadales bacterium]NIN49411.1 efflux RND transporter periplasmic adaptor subunit [Gemmatimonadales bacterium]NIP06875.1 efflux RND transporter periplasmic adaptor subunit [Gemmatimonadales bacterium]NIR01549.1 efflux RND transporter periplasmic adaptor subunit [Gemmatimonadales bacterium]
MKRIGILILVAITAVVAVTLAARNSNEEEIPVYQLVPVSTRDIVVSASAAGVVEPVTTVDIKSKASGEIMEVRVETGDVVSPGQLLVKVDPRVPRNALQQAEADLDVAKAQLANAESQLRRAEELYQTQSITEQEYETANLNAATARAQLVRAERSLEDARISFEDTDVRAPIRGVIIEKAVEVGTVISSATREVGGGTVLLRMANLDTVQVRSLVDETDIGKIRAEMDVTITVDAYPNQPFQGQVLKIEPQATVQQNVTMFAVLVRIPNRQGLLRPGMSAEAEVHVGERRGVLAIPNAALRTDRDVGSAATVLGLDPETVQQQIAAARDAARERAAQQGEPGGASHGDTAAASPHGETITMGGREITLPEGVTADQVRAVFQRMREGGGPQGLSAEDRAVLEKMRSAGGGMGGGRSGRQRASSDEYLFGGNYIVFAVRNDAAMPIPIRTGLTDLDYSEVISGLTQADTVLILPSASLLASQQEFQERMGSRFGGLPGVSRR